MKSAGKYFPWLLLIGLFLGAVWSASAVERFPPPDFDAGYKFPTTTTPAAREAWLQIVDVLVLLGALSMSTLFVLKKRSRAHILGLTVFSALYFGFYRKGCVCSVGSTQDVALAFFNPGYAVPWTVLAFFLLPLVFTLIFGRTFCAAVCPLGAMQDLVVVKPKALPVWLEQGLGIIPFIYLGLGVLLAATGSLFLFCEYDPFIALYRRSGNWPMLAMGAGFILVGAFIGRPYCRFLCPYGAMLSVLGRFSKWNVTLTPQDCVHCQLCDIACPYGAIKEPVGELPAPSAAQRKRRLFVVTALLPVLVLAGALIGRQLGTPLSMLHPNVSLAEQIALEDSGKTKQTTKASEAFRDTGKPKTELFATALRIRGEFLFGGALLGAFAGLVIGLKLIGLSAVVKRTIFEPDTANCVACGRCYTHCPNDLIRIKREQKAKSIPLTPA
ncbi:MAG: 4Fe-4S binding protein [Verrucomicrobiota bacterium]